MTDRELLELAAKAAGIELRFSEGFEDDLSPRTWPALGLWNPLTDDGDALRLSVSMCIDVLHRFVGGQRVDALAPGGSLVTEYCDHKTREAATRRAIVRAASAIGQSLPATSSASSS